MHRFNMGNDNPIRNTKLLREAYEEGRRQALNENLPGGVGAPGILDPIGIPQGPQTWPQHYGPDSNPEGDSLYPGGLRTPRDRPRPGEGRMSPPTRAPGPNSEPICSFAGCYIPFFDGTQWHWRWQVQDGAFDGPTLRTPVSYP